MKSVCAASLLYPISVVAACLSVLHTYISIYIISEFSCVPVRPSEKGVRKRENRLESTKIFCVTLASAPNCVFVAPSLFSLRQLFISIIIFLSMPQRSEQTQPKKETWKRKREKGRGTNTGHKKRIALNEKRMNRETWPTVCGSRSQKHE